MIAVIARVRAELAAAEADPERVPFLGAGRAAWVWRRTRLVRSALMLGLGSAWDAATLTRIDRWSDQAILTSYQVGFALLVAVELRVAAGRPVPGWLARRPHLVHYASQFLLGSLLSAFTVYYVRGAASPRAALFVGLLIALLVGNELVEAPLRVLWARMSLLAFCQFNGLLFVLPVVTRQLVPMWAVAALGIAVVAGVLLLARAGTELRSLLRGVAPAALTLAAIQGLVWAQVLPPLPLSLHRVGVFHDVVRTDHGYALTWEREPIFGRAFWRYDRVFHRQADEAVWCFTALFAPRGMALQVVHVWERLGPDGWQEADRMPLDVEGGRAEGFRTYSRKQNVPPGDWRVRIELPTGRELGRVGFEVVDGPPEHPLVTEVL